MNILHTAHAGSTESKLFSFTHGIHHDCYLAAQEVRVQVAWARELTRLGCLSVTEFQLAEQLLLEAGEEMANGKFEWRESDEDIHMNLERFICERAGDLGKKIHIGRSRNDLIATTLRLFVADQCSQLQKQIALLVEVFVNRAHEVSPSLSEGFIIPGLTHLQFGQPILLSHVLESFARGLERCARAFESVKKEALYSLPLGAGAFAGTTLAIDGHALAAELGFLFPCLNSYDSVGDRDFLLQFLDAQSLLMTQLARQSHDFIFWSSTPVGLVKLPKAWSTGSSMMPNKRNPDVPELIRAKSARSIARASAGKNMVHALCSSYASDLHELKKECVDSVREVSEVLDVYSHFCAAVEFEKTGSERLLSKGHVLATDAAQLLCNAGLPFRKAYGAVAELIQLAESQGVQIHELNLEASGRGTNTGSVVGVGVELKHATRAQGCDWESLTKSWEQLSFQASVLARRSQGGTGYQNI